MKLNKIEEVTLVSDGIVVEFADGTVYYFPAESLYAHKAELDSQQLVKADSVDLDENPELQGTTALLGQFVPRYHN